MKKPLKSWVGKIVSVTWSDPSGYINSELSEVKLSVCVSIGTLISYDDEKVILRSSKYEGSDVGDYSILATGCCTKFELAV